WTPSGRRTRKKAVRMKRIVIFLFLALLAGGIMTAPMVTGSMLTVRAAAPAGDDRPVLRLEDSLDAMGTVYTVVLYGRDRFGLRTAVELAFEEVHRLDRLLSNYRPGSEWSQVNRQAAHEPVKVSKELF